MLATTRQHPIGPKNDVQTEKSRLVTFCNHAKQSDPSFGWIMLHKISSIYRETECKSEDMKNIFAFLACRVTFPLDTKEPLLMRQLSRTVNGFFYLVRT